MKYHAIFGTDLSKPPQDLIEDIRHQMVQARGQLFDIGQVYPGWGERLVNAEGLLTCGIAYLYDIKDEMDRCSRAGAPPTKET